MTKKSTTVITKLQYVVILLTVSSLSECIPCISGDWNVSLDDAIHFSDVVLDGHIRRSRKGEFGTYNVTVSSRYAFKYDEQFSWRNVEITNFFFEPTQKEHKAHAIFFLIRQQNTNLALHCMSSVSAYAHQYPSTSNLISHIRKVGSSDNLMNSQTDLPYPNPCDNNSISGCSVLGSECSVQNTLPNEITRCTCVTGFYGDGKNCTALTTEAANAYCEECGAQSRCELVAEQTVLNELTEEPTTPIEKKNCNCDHFRCLKERFSNQQVCGMDGNTYSTICHMRRASCVSQEPIHLLHTGVCDATIKACGGSSLPLYTTAGVITCERSPCPLMHSCEKTAKYSVCCPVVVGDGSGYPSESGNGDEYSDTESSGYPYRTGDQEH